MSKRGMVITIVIIVLVVLMVGIITSNKDNVTYAAGDTLASVVINQSKGTTWSSGASGVYNTIYTKEDGTTIGSDYRYIGGSVNNYVKFNDDLYQIIGVFDENTHGKTGQQLVKLIRAKILGAYSWGVYNNAIKDGSYSSYKNDWTGKQYATPANTNILLNEYFYNKTSSSDTYGECNNWTYFNSDNNYKTTDCSTLVGDGIKENLRDYIETTTWHLNGYNATGLTSNNFYLCERGQYTNCTSVNNGAGDTSTSAKIGLMYLSDYMYASGYKENTSTLTGSSSYNGSQNWMFKGEEWTITPNYSTALSVFHVSSGGRVYGAESYYGHRVRPTFYLKSNVYVTGGEGSFSNPYTIAYDGEGSGGSQGGEETINLDISSASITINKGSGNNISVSGGGLTNTIEVSNTEVLEITGSSNTNSITVTDCNANILLNNVTINSSSAFSLNGSASVNLQITGTNNLTSTNMSGITVPSTASLTISEKNSGVLNATGATGIGSADSKAGTITINSGTINAEATGMGGAGIGGADLVSVTINGGNITATGSGGGNAIDRFYGGGAGIGTVGGSDIGGVITDTSLTGSIRINGGTIVATGAYYGASIGAGSGASEFQTAPNIYISSSANVTLYHNDEGAIEEGWTGNSQ